MVRQQKRRFLRNLLLVQAGAILLSAVTVLALFLHGVGALNTRADNVANDSRVATLMANSEAEMSGMVEIMTRRVTTFLTSPEVLALAVEEQSELRRGLLTPEVAVTTQSLANMLIPLSLTEAIEFQQSMDVLEPAGAALIDSSATTDRVAASADVDETKTILTRYFVQPTVANFKAFLQKFSGLLQDLRASRPTFTSQAMSSQGSLTTAIDVASWVTAASLVALTACVLAVTAFAFRRVRQAMETSLDEREMLKEAGDKLFYRNSQLSALYNVFSEITDTLSLKYVVGTAVKEAQKLVNADAVVLRLAREGNLVCVGSITAAGQPLENVGDISLTQGPIGRAVKRGKPLRVDEDVVRLFEGSVNDKTLQSCVVVPLIIGARVVGTLGCWSKQSHAFSDDDERILELMASQIATAVAAADSSETSERRALSDALTGLPNRRQMEEDMSGDFTQHLETGGSAVVAMVDVDHFKRFNDDFGHRVGDVTLQKVANVMRTSVREEDRVYRLGGEEFLIVFMNAGADDAVLLAERVRAAVASAPLTGDALQPVGPVTISMGLSLAPQHSAGFPELMEMADVALYRAKESGRNCVVLSDGEKPVAREMVPAA